MIKFKNENLNQAIYAFNLLLSSAFIENLIKNKMDEFDQRYTNIEKSIIADLLFTYKNEFKPTIKLYRPFWRWSKAYATTYTGNYSLIKINSRKINRSFPSLAGTICHEWGHCFEYYVKTVFPEYYFNHGNNSSVGKENTFQYWIGNQLRSELMKYDSFKSFKTAFNAGLYDHDLGLL